MKASGDEVAIAHRTLRDGSAFIGLAPRRPLGGSIAGANLLGNRVDVRLLGNGLRELDRFLGVLVEEVADRIGSSAHDPRAFARLRNTANKLRSVRAMMNLGSPDHRWLRAVGRLRACLHHCDGEWRRPRDPEDLSLDGCEVTDNFPNRKIVLTSEGLDRISLTYLRVGNELVAALNMSLAARHHP